MVINELQQVPGFLKIFVRNPIRGIARLPAWHWGTFIVLLATMSLVSGLFQGLFSWSWVDLLLGVTLLPIFSILGSFLISFCIAHYFSAFQHVYLDRQRLFGIVAIASLPYFTLHIFSSLVSAVDLVGFAFFCLVLIVGLNEQFHLNRKKTVRAAVALYIVYAGIWTYSQIRSDLQNRQANTNQVPQSLDRLEKEVTHR